MADRVTDNPRRRLRWLRRALSHRRRSAGAGMHSSRSAELPDTLYAQRLYELTHLIGGEWDTDILVALGIGPLRYSELLLRVNEIAGTDGWSKKQHQRLTHGVLSKCLRRLQTYELIERTSPGDFPQKAIYARTPFAEVLLSSLGPAVHSAQENAVIIERIRRRLRDDGEDSLGDED